MILKVVFERFFDLLFALKAYLNKDHVQLSNVHLFFLKEKNKQTH